MTLECGFDPQKARGKRPVPMWADAFLRDTLDLEADEIGAYHLLFYAMWKKPECSLSNDPKRLAKIARVSTRLWNTRIGPALMELFEEKDGYISSSKLAKEAKITEAWCTSQHSKKCEACKKRRACAKPQNTLVGDRINGEKSGKLLKTNNAGLTTDISPDDTEDTTTEHPTQLPNSNNNSEDKSSSLLLAHARDNDDLERFLKSHPRPRETGRGEAAWADAIAEGVEPSDIIAAAERYAVVSKSYDADKIKFSDNWLVERAWEKYPASQTKKADAAEQLKWWAGKIAKNAEAKEKLFGLTAKIANACLEQKLVSQEQIAAVSP